MSAGRATGSEATTGMTDRQTITGTIRLFQAELLCAGVVFLAALSLYSWTLAPTVTLTDSGELIVVAHNLGVAHPPGFPLWVMLAHLATMVPFGSVALRINFTSAFFAALACAMLPLVVAELMMGAASANASKLGKKGARQNKRAAPPGTLGEIQKDSRSQRLLVLAPALGSGLLMVFSRTLWSYATVAEVYALNALLILAISFLMLRWRRCLLAKRLAGTGANTASSRSAAGSDIFLYVAALIFGLALGVHHVTVALVLPAFAVVVYRTEGMAFFGSRRLLYAALISVGALIAVYSYLPLAASRAPVINWGTPRSLQEIWWHVTGRQYQVFLAFTPKIIGEQAVEFGRMVLREFGPPWVPLALLLACAGLGNAFRRDRTAFWFLVTVIAANLAYAFTYSIAEDKDAYYLPTFISLTVAAGFGLYWVIQLALSERRLFGRAYLVAAFSVLLVSAIAFSGNWPFNNRRHYFIARDYVENLLSAIEPNGLLLTLDWQVASPMLYAQEVEQLRPDVKVVDVNLLRRSWYFDYLRHAYPALIERSHEKVEAFFADLKQWELDPQGYANDPERSRRITALFEEMIQSMVTNENRIAPVYITSDLPFADKRDGELVKWLNDTFQFVPQGLVFNLAGDRLFHDSPEVKLQTRGLADGSIRFEKDDPVNLKVLPVYTSMLVNRGRYLTLFNQPERAVAAFEQALALDPGLVTARKGIEENTSKLRNQ